MKAQLIICATFATLFTLLTVITLVRGGWLFIFPAMFALAGWLAVAEIREEINDSIND